jgi:hypothetical protein
MHIMQKDILGDMGGRLRREYSMVDRIMCREKLSYDGIFYRMERIII